MQSQTIVVVRDIEREFPVHAIPSGEVYTDLCDLHEYCTFSSNVYEEEDDRISITDWVLFERPNIPQKPQWKIKIGGLGCEAWVKKRSESNNVVLIVFRGTDFKQTGDWFSNLRWITKFIPFTWDQYAQTRELIPPLVGRIRKKFGDETIIMTTGHSLGGGLAQQAAYISEHIKLVYAFDASTVTGYYDVPRKVRINNSKGMKIYRVYEHGEILAYLRLLFKALYPVTSKDPKIVEIRYNLTSGNPIGQHSIKNLALALNQIAASFSRAFQ